MRRSSRDCVAPMRADSHPSCRSSSATASGQVPAVASAPTDLPTPEPEPAGRSERVSTRWMWFGALPVIGFWVPFVAGYRARHRGWMLAGMGVIAFALFADIFSTVEESNRFGGMFLLLSWILNGAVSCALRRPCEQRMAAQAAYDDRIARAEHRATERRAMMALAAENPGRAAALGVGRADLPGTRHGYLVDVNHAPASAIASLPGVSQALATEIARVRDQLGGFDSVDDLGALMALHPRIVEAMRTRAVALPD